jgi:HD-GYP domain-containing protein (c-di-GMP phosphodiesterase class II)
MASRRPYRESLGEEAAHDAVVAGSGTQFDPVVVAAFVRVMADGFTFSTPEPGQV